MVRDIDHLWKWYKVLYQFNMKLHIAILNQLHTNRASLIMIKLVLIQPFQQKNYTYITWKNQKLDNELPA